MKEQFIHFIEENKLCNPQNRLLLAISGGVDSMTMLHLFLDCGFNVSMAHCNFGLRDAESDGDEEFVSRTAMNLGIPLYVKRFDTKTYAEEHKVSIQMAARDLRYSWFRKLMQEHGFNKIATAHHANDVAETFLINLTRGTGIKGLTGIAINNNQLIRPLLFATRKEIESYATLHEVGFRQDSSNQETKYLRNSIRQSIIPLFENLNPSFIKTINQTTLLLKEASDLYQKHIDQMFGALTRKTAENVYIDIEKIKNQKISPTLLFEYLSQYGFTLDTATRLIENIDSQPGAIYYAAAFKIVKDRKDYIVCARKEDDDEEYLIGEEQTHFDGPISLTLSQISIDAQFILKRNKEIASFDLSKLTFPLILRRWQHGDYFYPLGMRGKKKLSDYFTDKKISLPEKETIWLICSGSDIIWVVNHRTDNRYCITKSTPKVLQIELLT